MVTQDTAKKQAIRLVECPRDAMQGLHDFIPTDKKVAYINQLLKVGFDTIDFGSFVSPKAIPQMPLNINKLLISAFHFPFLKLSSNAISIQVSPKVWSV